MLSAKDAPKIAGQAAAATKGANSITAMNRPCDARSAGATCGATNRSHPSAMPATTFGGICAVELKLCLPVTRYKGAFVVSDPRIPAFKERISRGPQTADAALFRPHRGACWLHGKCGVSHIMRPTRRYRFPPPEESPSDSTVCLVKEPTMNSFQFISDLPLSGQSTVCFKFAANSQGGISVLALWMGNTGRRGVRNNWLTGTKDGLPDP